MLRTVCVTLVVAGAVSACAPGTPRQTVGLDPATVVKDSAAALGGVDRVLAVKTLTLAGKGTAYNLGQDMGPETTGQTFVGDYTRQVDLAARRAVSEHTRTPTFLYFAGQAPQKQVQGIDGDVGFNVPPTGAATRVPPAIGKDRQAEFYHHPIAILQAALDPGAMLSNVRTMDGQVAVDVVTAAGTRLTLTVDQATKRPARVISKADNTNLGDVAIETTFAEYQDVGGLQLPAKLTTKTDRWTTMEIQVAKNTVNGAVGNLAAPPPPATPPPPPTQNVTAEELGKGVWSLAGGSHNSVLVEFSDHLTLVEVPLNDARTLAVIAKARSLQPNKPLTHVVNLHHHFDHSGGVRAAVSEGLTVIAQKNSEAFLKEMVSRPHTIVPDALAKNPKPLKLELVDDMKMLSDGSMALYLYRIAGSAHSTTALMAYVPSVKLLVEGDDFSGGGGATAIYPFTPALLADITRRNLQVDRVLGIHGPISPFSDLVKAGKAPS